MSNPSVASDSSITLVSTLWSVPSSRVELLASAARMSARLVRLFEPGGRIDPVTGRVTDVIRRAGEVIGGLAATNGSFQNR